MKSDKETLHMLGYFPPVAWADALKEKSLDKARLYELMREQEKQYNFDLVSDVEWLLEDIESFREALKKFNAGSR